MTHPADAVKIARNMIEEARQGPPTLREHVRAICELAPMGGLPPGVVVWTNERDREIVVELITGKIELGRGDVSHRGIRWTGYNGATGNVAHMMRSATLETVYTILRSWTVEEDFPPDARCPHTLGDASCGVDLSSFAPGDPEAECDKTYDCCRLRFDNGKRFGGWPKL